MLRCKQEFLEERARGEKDLDRDALLALLASPLWFIALWGFWKLKQRREGQLQLDNQSA